MAEITYQMILSTLQTMGLLVGIFYYIMTLNNTRKNQELTLKSQELTRKAQEHATETRQAQLFMQILIHFTTPTMTESKIFYADLEINSLEDYQKLWNDHETNKLIRYWGGFIEGIGVLVRENYLDIKVIAGLMGGMVKTSWENQAPYIMEMREKYNSPRGYIEWEYLYDALMKYAEEHPELGIKEVERASFFDSTDRP